MLESNINIFFIIGILGIIKLAYKTTNFIRNVYRVLRFKHMKLNAGWNVTYIHQIKGQNFPIPVIK